jgi:hypothetical protein
MFRRVVAVRSVCGLLELAERPRDGTGTTMPTVAKVPNASFARASREGRL